MKNIKMFAAKRTLGLTVSILLGIRLLLGVYVILHPSTAIAVHQIEQTIAFLVPVLMRIEKQVEKPKSTNQSADD